MAKKNELQMKLSLLQKLFDTGCVTEKQLQGLEIEDILLIPSITIDEMKELVVLQKCCYPFAPFLFDKLPVHYLSRP